MRERAHSSRLTSKSRQPRARHPTETCDWRTCVRPLLLTQLVERTRSLRWSPQLVELLLEELHISDDFDRLIGQTADRSAAQYPQLLALALALRHSWCPQDFARVVRKLGLSTNLPRSTTCSHSNRAAAATAVAPPSVRRSQGRERSLD
jgi:hypothetical protein